MSNIADSIEKIINNSVIGNSTASDIDYAYLTQDYSMGGDVPIKKICDMAEGTDKVVIVGTYNGVTIRLRPLNSYEQNVLCALIPEDIVNKQYSDLPDHQKAHMVGFFSVIVRLIIASCSDSFTSEIGCNALSFKKIHDSASIRMRDLLLISHKSLFHLLGMQENIEKNLNPSLENLGALEMEGMLTAIKKSPQMLSGLNWSVCTQLLRHVLQKESEGTQEDKLYLRT